MIIEGVTILCDDDLAFALRKKFSKAVYGLNHSKEFFDKFQDTIQIDMDLVKKNYRPRAVIAARIYTIGLLLRETRTQNKIAEVVGTCVPSIRKLYKIINKINLKKSDSKIDVKCNARSQKAYYFLVREKYEVRIERGTEIASCECLGDIFMRGGRKQKECKHIQKARELLKVVGK